MFPRRLRLARAALSPAAFAHGQRRSSPHFSLVVPDSGAGGYAVIISKKTLRLSVARHRMKRRVLAALRALPLPRALIVFPRREAERLSPAELRDELAALLSKIAQRT